MTVISPPIAALSFLKRSQKSCRGDLPSIACSGACGAAENGSETAVM